MSFFSSDTYYTLRNDEFGGDRRLSCRNNTPPANVKMTVTQRYPGSEDWQLFFSHNVTFIRNVVSNSTFHLGVTKDDMFNPRMMPATRSPGQQWTITKWDNSSVYKMVNNLVEAQTPGLFLTIGGSPHGVILGNSTIGARWSIQDDPFHQVSQDMLVQYGSVPTATPFASPSSTPGLRAPGSGATHDGLTGLQKTGIAVGVVVFVSMIICFLLLFIRYKRHGSLRARGVPGPTPPPPAPRHGHAEVVTEHLPAYSAKPKAADERSIELPDYGSPSVEAKSFV